MFDLRSSPLYIRIAFLRSFLCIKTFDCSKAQKIIGYSPVISLEEGIMSTTDSFSHLARGSSYMRELDLSKSSNVEKLLGCGKVADILLWRDETKTFAFALGLFLFLHWFLLSERTFLTSTAKLLLLISVILFGHGRLPPTMFGFTIEKISPFSYEVSETTMRTVLNSLLSVWNRGIYMVNTLARGEDWSIFLGVAAALYFFKLLSQCSPSIVIGIGFVALFTVFIIYEQCEEDIDRLIGKATVGVNKARRRLLANLPGFLADYC